MQQKSFTLSQNFHYTKSYKILNFFYGRIPLMGKLNFCGKKKLFMLQLCI